MFHEISGFWIFKKLNNWFFDWLIFKIFNKIYPKNIDTFKMYFVINKTNEPIKLNISKMNIAWDTDKKFKFANPQNLGI